MTKQYSRTDLTLALYTAKIACLFQFASMGGRLEGPNKKTQCAIRLVCDICTLHGLKMLASGPSQGKEARFWPDIRKIG